MQVKNRIKGKWGVRLVRLVATRRRRIVEKVNLFCLHKSMLASKAFNMLRNALSFYTVLKSDSKKKTLQLQFKKIRTPIRKSCLPKAELHYLAETL